MASQDVNIVTTANQDIHISTTEENISLVSQPADDIVIAGTNIGMQGPEGPPGESGDVHYVHNQINPTTQWTVTHNLNKYPSVTIIDSGGTTVIGNINYVSPNQIILEFEAPFGGKALLN